MSDDAGLRLRLELVTGGPARSFPLTVRDADTLASGLDALIEQFQTQSLIDGGDPVDVRVIEDMRTLRDRLYVHSGYGPRST